MKIVGHSYGIANAPKNRRKSHHDVGTIDFVGIDGEGINLPDGGHNYALLGMGNYQIENKDGLVWHTILKELYELYQPRVAFVGYYLSYDFNRWIRTMPYDRAHRLLTSEGIASRKTNCANYHGKTLPVDMPFGWQIHMLGTKQFKFRQRSCNCDRYTCDHDKGPWMHICDAGPFFQTSLLKAIAPEGWKHPIVSDDEYEFIKAGKEKRAFAFQIDDEMREYNMLENEILVRLTKTLNHGFREMGIVLSPRQWFGPGQAAQKWMGNENVPKKEVIHKAVPQWFLQTAGMSYFGGWFEIMMHGIIPGITHEYDINSAYPYIIKSLPCLLHGTYDKGNDEPPKDIKYVLVFAEVSSRNGKHPNVIGTMLHRCDSSRICRPVATKGWYWLHELNAAKRAGLITDVHYYEWMSYDPCDCLPPMRNVSALYDLRLKVGKNTSLGKGSRLAYNSMYGKFAQSIGDPIYANAIWASLITAGCRTMILDAIATHPNGQYDVCMVATDAVYFVSPHPTLQCSTNLGEWEHIEHSNLTLFKPGMYWNDKTRKDVAENRNPVFKARGISGADFADSIAIVDRLFEKWESEPPALSDNDGRIDGWPHIEFHMGFSMASCLQAIRWNQWELAGHVFQDVIAEQNANPYQKRLGVWRMPLEDGRMIWRSVPQMIMANNDEIPLSLPYLKRFGMEDPWSDEFTERELLMPDGTILEVLHDRIMKQ